MTAFLAWAGDPKLEERKGMGWLVMLYLLITSVLLYFAKKRLWAGCTDQRTTPRLEKKRRRSLRLRLFHRLAAKDGGGVRLPVAALHSCGRKLFAGALFL